MDRMRSRGDVEGERIARDLTRVEYFEPTLTQMAPALDTDINEIVRRFGLLGEMPPPMAADASFYGDFDMDFSLGDAMQRVRDASERFASLPVAIRTRFHNSPAELWSFVMDPRNAAEAVDLGLLKAPESPSDGRSSSAPPPGNPPAPSGAGSASGA